MKHAFAGICCVVGFLVGLVMGFNAQFDTFMNDCRAMGLTRLGDHVVICKER